MHKHFLYVALPLMVLVAGAGCGSPSPTRVCERAQLLAERSVGGKLPNKDGLLATCIENAERLRAQKPEAYDCLATCVLKKAAGPAGVKVCRTNCGAD